MPTNAKSFAAKSPAATGRCPICGAPATAATRPFCSKVCRDRDILKWLDEDYRTPVPPEEPDID